MKISFGKQKITLKRVLLYLLILAGVVLLLYLLVYQPYEVRKDRERYKQAELNLLAIRENVEKATGKAVSSTEIKTCTYASREFTRGPLSCNISIYLGFPGKNYSESTSLMINAARVVRTNLSNPINGSKENSFVPKEQRRGTQMFTQEFISDSLICNVTYSYPDSLHNLKDVLNGVDGLEITLTCGGPAKAEFYPLED